MDNNELKIIIPVVLGTIVICLIMCAAVALAKSRRTTYRTERIDSFNENIEQGSSNSSWLRSPRSQRYIQIPEPATTRPAEPTAVSDPPPAYQQSQHDVRVQISPA
ncbi:hypothetical protein O0I10_005169 [Lichtheimia ornata]|uniref:Uncharacterized protein n=1 Tax=Lichtheimia ornata TaxID=688661 RepID=A0AAD7V6E3_9FUNG|nr:uncharacterized protein O0I10_005169 [Lichtheimia ornata]KAJ8659130.1 hypothetical protein O0I10_005169 [Lichtheimia ornata]